MRIIDHDAELRRAEKYTDISRSAFALFVIALALVAAFAVAMFFTERAGG